MKNNWQVKRLEEVTDIYSGGTPRRSIPEYWGDDIPWLTMEDTNNFDVRGTVQHISSEGLQNSNAQLVPAGSVNLSCTASVGNVTINRIPLATNQQFNSFHPHEELVTEFLAYQLIHRKRDIEALGGTTTFSFINKTAISNFQIQLPPLDTQKKIAEILSSIDEAIQKTDQIIQKTEKLKRGLTQNILNFGNKEEVRYLALGDIGKVSMCKRIFKNETSDNGDIPFYKIGTFGKEPDSFITQELYDSYRSKYPFPKIGDVLLSASGTIGRKVKYDGKPAYFQDSNIVWLEHDESKILNNFLFYLYDTITWQTEGSTIKRLYNDILLKKVILVPSLKKQRQIIEVLSAVDAKISFNNKLKEKLNLLKNGLMQDIFSRKVQIN